MSLRTRIIELILYKYEPKQWVPIRVYFEDKHLTGCFLLDKNKVVFHSTHFGRHLFYTLADGNRIRQERFDVVYPIPTPEELWNIDTSTEVIDAYVSPVPSNLHMMLIKIPRAVF